MSGLLPAEASLGEGKEEVVFGVAFIFLDGDLLVLVCVCVVVLLVLVVLCVWL